MIKRNYRALIDGMIFGTIIFLLGKYSVSSFVSFDSMFWEMMITFLSILVSAISAVYNLKYECIRELLVGYLVSLASGICWLSIIFSVDIWINPLFQVNFISQRELSNADGLIIILLEGVFLIGAILLRIILFFNQLIKMQQRKKQ